MELSKLKEPFPADRISWRVGSTTADKSKGMALAYIDARDVQDRLDEVCGVDSWQCRYVPMHDKKTVCEIGIRMHPTQMMQKSDGFEIMAAEWVWKADGAGDSDVEAEKGALSDAFKRAAVKWGIGRYLYDLDSPWVELEPAGRSYKIAAKEYARLESILNRSKPLPKPQTQPATAASAKPKLSAKEWGQNLLANLRLCPVSELDEALNKNAAALVKLHATEPVLHKDIIKLVQSRQELGK